MTAHSLIDEFTDLRGVTMQRAERATEYLVWGANDLGMARALKEQAEKRLKIAEDRGFLKAKGSVREREALARTSEDYGKAFRDWCDAAERYEVLKATADSASQLIDTWRSINSTQKAAKV